MLVFPPKRYHDIHWMYSSKLERWKVVFTGCSKNLQMGGDSQGLISLCLVWFLQFPCQTESQKRSYKIIYPWLSVRWLFSLTWPGVRPMLVFPLYHCRISINFNSTTACWNFWSGSLGCFVFFFFSWVYLFIFFPLNFFILLRENN